MICPFRTHRPALQMMKPPLLRPAAKPGTHSNKTGSVPRADRVPSYSDSTDSSAPPGLCTCCSFPGILLPSSHIHRPQPCWLLCAIHIPLKCHLKIHTPHTPDPISSQVISLTFLFSVYSPGECGSQSGRNVEVTHACSSLGPQLPGGAWHIGQALNIGLNECIKSFRESIYTLVCLATLWGFQDLSSPAGIVHFAVGASSPDQWTTREVPRVNIFSESLAFEHSFIRSILIYRTPTMHEAQFWGLGIEW